MALHVAIKSVPLALGTTFSLLLNIDVLLFNKLNYILTEGFFTTNTYKIVS